LRSLVRVVDHALWSALVKSHVQSRQDQLTLQVARHCPTHDAAGEGIHDDTEIQEARPSGYVGDVSHPEFIDRWHSKVSLYQIGSLDSLMRFTGRCGALSATDATNAHLTHQTRHALLAYSDVYIHQIFKDARGTIGAI